jgi:diguanylate cyclase (GGDEF)-like protein
MRREPMTGRLYLGVVSALLLMAAIVAGTIYCSVGTRRVAEPLYQREIVAADRAAELEVLLERHRRAVSEALLEFDLDQTSRDRDGLSPVDLKKRFERLVGQSTQEFAARAGPMLAPLWKSGEDVLRLADANAQEAALTSLRQYAAEADRMLGLIREYRRAQVDRARHEARFISDNVNVVVQLMATLAFIALLMIGLLGFALLRGAIAPWERTTAAMHLLARRDANADEIASGDEIGEMAKAVFAFKRNTVQPQRLNRWLDIAINNMTVGLSMFDGDQRLVICNGVYKRLYDMPDTLARPGVAFSEIVRHRATLVASVDGHEGEGPDGLAPALAELIGKRMEARSRQRLGNGRMVEISIKPLPWGGWVALHEDVTERLVAAERITRLARQDALTGVANRRHFQEGLEEAIAGLSADGTFALLVIDLDHFKDVNDTLGHPVGDALLTIVGHRLTKLARRRDIVARLGGDEFAIIQREASERSDADALARRVVDVLRQPFLAHGKRVEIGGTIGIALVPDDGRTAEDVMRKADIALYRAKALGRGTWRFFDPEMEGRLKARRQLELDLAGAAKRGELDLFYQPIVSLAARRVEGCEALIRWRHPLRGMVSPNEFIPIAEETGLICEIGAWAIDEACKAAAAWPEYISISVNLSVAQFAGPDLVLATARALEQSGLDTSRLVLEVTETLLLGDDPATFDLLHRLRDLGVAIALDDFGTGYSSLSHLRSFPFDKIKIDQSFVRDLPQRKNCEAIVGAVARLASSLEMTTVAEGVETEDHLARVEAAGCDAVQGYLFSRPVPRGDLADVVAEIDRRLASGRVEAA